MLKKPEKEKRYIWIVEISFDFSSLEPKTQMSLSDQHLPVVVVVVVNVSYSHHRPQIHWKKFNQTCYK